MGMGLESHEGHAGHGCILAAALFCLSGCAPFPPAGAASGKRLPESQAASAGHSAPPTARRSNAAVDAVLPSGRNLFLFDFTQSRYRKWTLAEGPNDTLGLCRILDTLQGDGAVSGWLALPAPSQPFAPMRAFWGPSGNFFLLDRAAKRLVQYDSSAQFLSSFPLPREIRDRGLDRFEVYWTRDGLFSFLDLGEGTVRQYAELRAPGGQGDWRLRNTIRLPVGLETCVWEPYLRNPCCRRGDAGRPVCFDAYFNPLGPWPGDRPAAAGLRPFPDGSGGWSLILDGGPACAPSRSPVCFSPDKGLLSTCPAETDAAPAP
jgi:hypothetical protein